MSSPKASTKKSVSPKSPLVSASLAELADLKEQIADRRSYLNQQEFIIEQALEAGNQRLISRQREILAAELMKEDLLRQILVLRDQITELTHKSLILQQRYEQEAAK